jgi:hypothetical protein
MYVCVANTEPIFGEIQISILGSLAVNRLIRQKFGRNQSYYKPMTIINDDSRVITKLETSLTDTARVINYNHRMFIAQAKGR